MNLTIVIQTVTCLSALMGIFFTSSTPDGSSLLLKAIAGGAVLVTTIFSVVLAIRDDKEKGIAKRALNNLIKSVRPSDVILEGLREAIRKQMLVVFKLQTRELNAYEGGLTCFLLGGRTPFVREGMLIVRLESLVDLSIVDGAELPQAINSSLLSGWGSDNLEQDLHFIADRFCETASMAYQLQLGKRLRVRMVVNAAQGTLTISPPNLMDGSPTQDWVHFSRDHIQHLLSLPVIYRTHQIALDCEQALAKA